MILVDLDPIKTGVIDAAVAKYLDGLRLADQANAAATLGYTHGIHREWRQVIRMLPIPAGSAVLDVGMGLGLLPLELAANVDLWVAGIDLDPEFVEHAAALSAQLEEFDLFKPGADLQFSVGDACELEFDDATFDLVFLREVVQFVSEPVTALSEALRVLRPGGFACVGDTDDQLRITWPPPSPPLARLVDAVDRAQSARGGDRHSGRKLTTYLRQAGFSINSIVVIPEAQHRLVQTDDAERLLVIEQLRAVRSRVLAEGTTDPESFDADLHELENQGPFEEFRLNARIIALAQRPD